MSWIDDIRSQYVGQTGTITPEHTGVAWDGEWLCTSVQVLDEVAQKAGLVVEHTDPLVTRVPPRNVVGSYDAVPEVFVTRPEVPLQTSSNIPPEWFLITP